MQRANGLRLGRGIDEIVEPVDEPAHAGVAAHQLEWGWGSHAGKVDDAHRRGMPIDPENPVVKLCAQGMAIEGDSAAASALFAEAWAACTNDYDSAVAAHFIARHQPTAEDTLRWNQLALEHALLVGADQVTDLLPSLYLNVGDSYRLVGN